MPVATPQNRALVTSGKGLAASAAGFRLWLGGGIALPASFQPSLRLRCTSFAHRPQTEAVEEESRRAFVLGKRLTTASGFDLIQPAFQPFTQNLTGAIKSGFDGFRRRF
jgi:hypothetical protein